MPVSPTPCTTVAPSQPAPPPLRRDRAAELSSAALPSLGTSRHGLHHADPTRARHGVDRGRLDASAAGTVRSNGSAGRTTYAGPPRHASTPAAPGPNHPPAHGSRQEFS
ncbi:hypothetical protein ACFXGG_31215 [Streptomyces nigra]|uniref:hypothetical protein n=1 Tax=Streptomyces nigra TaxID=1827580 RepID=UPI0036BE9445